MSKTCFTHAQLSHNKAEKCEIRGEYKGELQFSLQLNQRGHKEVFFFSKAYLSRKVVGRLYSPPPQCFYFSRYY